MKLRGLLLITLVIGLGAGLAYAWLIDPVTYSEASPASVTQGYREAWLLMAAEAYAQDGDWARTRIRLDALHDAQLGQTVAALFERYQANGPNATARALAQLADRLDAKTAEMLVYLATLQAIPTPAPSGPPPHVTARPPAFTPSPTPTTEPLPTLTPTVTPVPDYRVIEQLAECVPATITPRLRVFVQDEAGNSVSGKEVWVTWDGGADRFFTGFKPEIDIGYGDFDMALDQTYSVGLDKPNSIIVSNLRAEPCGESGRTSWRLIFGPVVR
jgi:hypothetical protein